MKEEQKQPIQPPKSSGNGFFSKKWTFPVMYMGAAALILAFIVWYQDSQNLSFGKKDTMPQVSQGQGQGKQTAATTTPDQGAVPVNGQNASLTFPAAAGAEVTTVMNYYDDNAADDAKAAALVKYEDSYWPHTGVDLAIKDGKTSFDVVAAGAGKVTKAEKDPMVGNVVEIEHANGLATTYQSLDELKVKVGDEVKQGDTLGKAGRNLFEKSLGAHLHFEVKENGKAVSPEKYFTQKQAQ